MQNSTESAGQNRPLVDTGFETPDITKQLSKEAAKYYEVARKIVHGEVVDGGYVRFSVPRLDLPPIDYVTQGGKFANARYNALNEFSRYPTEIRRLAEAAGLKEAVTTSTSGAAIGVMGAPPIVLVPNDLIAGLRDTTNLINIEQGSGTARFSTMTIPSFGALSQNVEPSDITQTWATVDAVPSEYGAEQNVTYSAQQKFVGDVLAAETQAFRIAALVHEDATIIAALDAATAGNSLTNTIFSDAGVLGSQTLESQIDSTDTMSGVMLSAAVQKLKSRGVVGNLVAVMDGVQFESLFEDSNLVRFMQLTGQDDMLLTYQATGIIPRYAGCEIRQSTKITTGVGSGSITTASRIRLSEVCRRRPWT